MSDLKNLVRDLKKAGNPEKAKIFLRFFKTGKGQYGEGDKFLGITVPKQRSIAKVYETLPLTDIQTLLKSKIHEHRLVALIILTLQYKKAKGADKKKIVDFYLKNTKRINNWDLVDSSADKILGDYLFHKDKKVLYKLVVSTNLWERRIAIIATYDFIKKGRYDDTLKIAEILLLDKHDLIHKAVGWMLREVGKRDRAAEVAFLKLYADTMPRTTLRYSIEHFDPKQREKFMKMRRAL